MPRRIPMQIPAPSIADIWAYVTRELTGSLDPTAAQIWAATTRALTKPSEYDFSYSRIIPNQTPQTFNDTSAHDMTTLSIPGIDLLAGMTVKAAPIVIFVHAQNLTANAQDVDIDVYFRKAGESWGTAIFTEDDVISLPATDRSMIVFPCNSDVAAIIASGGDANYECKVTVQLSAAQNVQFMAWGIVTVIQRIA